MKKIGKAKKIALSVLIAGVAAGLPLAGTIPTAVFAEETYDITLTLKQNEGGRINSDISESVKTGETFSLEAVAEEGYRFSHWNLRSDGYHELVKGTEDDSRISVKVYESYARLFSAEAVFIKDDLYLIKGLPGIQESARAGEVFDLGENIKKNIERGKADDNYSFSIGVERISDGVNITKEVYDMETNTITMPNADIYIFMEAASSIVLDNVDMDKTTFTIENATNNTAEIPETAQAGEEVEIVTIIDYPGDEKKNVTYRIERISDGSDMTDTLMADASDNRFIMPFYDIRISVDRLSPEPSFESEQTEGDSNSNDTKYMTNVKAAYDLPDEGKNDTMEEGSGSAGGSQSDDESKACVGTECEKEIEAGANSEIKGSVDKNDPENIVKPSDTIVKTPVSVSASSGTVTNPAAVRMEGSSSTTASTVSAPATGDYNLTAAVTVAAIAAGAGIVAAVVILRKRMTD